MLQSYIWQELDLAPQFPILRRFLEFWRREIEGKLHSVRVGSVTVVKAPDVRIAGSVFTLH